MITPGFDGLTRSAGLLDLSGRGRIRVTGEDRARLLHAMTTNHVQQMKPGEGLYAFFLSAQGRIQADVYVLCFDDHLLLDTEAETRALVVEHLDRFIIADDATLEDISDLTFCLGLEGPKAQQIASAARITEPNHRLSHIEWGDLSIAAITSTGATGARIYGALSRKSDVVQLLEGAGAMAASGEDAKVARMRHFMPRFGEDITEHTLPQETQQMHGLHFQKGCYLGQEIVERIRSRGHINRTLMGFKLDGDAVPPPGAKLIAGGKEAGEVTSAALSPGDAVYGLAYIRVPYNKPGAIAGIDGKPVEIFAPFGAA